MPRSKLTLRMKNNRRDEMLAAALRISSEPGGWLKLTAMGIAKECHCSYGSVCLYLGSISAIRDKTVRAAIKQENFDVLIQALTAGHPEAMQMRPLLRQKAFAHTLNSGA